ncbi:AsmA-like C-terminal region-containing protein [Propionivibrio sp.]|uniref:AsmA-like C-terminal region-containing protein n=1 Tax=Propionivibrio sp. TaxID=2212460 RepID=UPI00262AAB86|nr:AsmA-like C-terminal region-containing protein [Propionivibrio sp.]
MESNLVYAKTASGEEAMKKRTRLMQRNVRMVLILVDGKSTVADLCLKTANPQLTEHALGELVNGGFIEPRTGHDAALGISPNDIQENDVHEIVAEANIASAGLSTSVEAPAPEPFAIESPVPPEKAASPPAASDLSVSMFTEDTIQSIQSVETSGEELLFPAEVPEEIADPSEMPDKDSDEFKPVEFKPALVERIKSLMSEGFRSSEDDISLEPITLRKAPSRSWVKAGVIGLLGALALTFLTLFFFPYDHYLPEVESAFAQATGRPVKVGTLRVDLVPNPGLLLGDVRVGTGGNEIRIAEIRLRPVVGTLFSSKMIFRQATLGGVTLPIERLAGLHAAFDAMTKPTARAGVEQLSLERVSIAFRGLGFTGMEGEARLSTGGSLQSLSLRSTDRSMNLEATPTSSGVGIALEGSAWRPFSGSPFLFDSISLSGTYRNGDFTIGRMEFYIFDGVVKGVGVLSADGKPSIFGQVSFERINASRFGTALGIGQQFTGETSGNIRYTASADSWATIFSALEANGEFAIRRGSIRGVDLAEAVRRISKTSVQGGSTLFESLSGKLKLTPERYQFYGLAMNSGLMQSTGNFEVSPDLKVNAKIELQMQGTVNQTRVPLSISGPLDAPIVKVGKG